MPLPDRLVEGTDAQGWQRLLDMLHTSGWLLDWHGGAEVRDAGVLLANWATLGVWLTPRTMVNLVANAPTEVLLDFDINRVDNEAEATAVSDFIQSLGRLLGQDVTLTYEGMPERVMGRYRHSVDAFDIGC
jgi:hypothetical protein